MQDGCRTGSWGIPAGYRRHGWAVCWEDWTVYTGCVLWIAGSWYAVCMPIPRRREELVGQITAAWTKLRDELDAAGPRIAGLPCVDGWSVKDLLYGWRETPRLNADIVRKARRESYASLRRRLEDGTVRDGARLHPGGPERTLTGNSSARGMSSEATIAEPPGSPTGRAVRRESPAPSRRGSSPTSSTGAGGGPIAHGRAGGGEGSEGDVPRAGWARHPPDTTCT